jgi:hypothetical protein
VNAAAGLGRWDPVSPRDAADLLSASSAPWWIAGGYAIDAFLDRHDRRPHEDVDVGLFARDQQAIRACLAGWDLHCADPPGTLRSWLPGEHLIEPIHDVWGREDTAGPWRLQLVLNPSDADGGMWIYRRDARIRLPLSELVWCSEGIPYLVPEVQLLFKSRTVRKKDAQDFEHVLPELDDARRAWLREALSLTTPEHSWLARL